MRHIYRNGLKDANTNRVINENKGLVCEKSKIYVIESKSRRRFKKSRSKYNKMKGEAYLKCYFCTYYDRKVYKNEYPYSMNHKKA